MLILLDMALSVMVIVAALFLGVVALRLLKAPDGDKNDKK